MYVQSIADKANKDHTIDTWEVFSALPDDANLLDGSLHMFPYKGNFYLSIGQKLWVKKSRDRTDPQVRTNAKDNWPKLFHDNWELVGAQALPAKDFRSLAPFVVESIDGKEMLFRLFAVTQEGSLQVCFNDELGASNAFQAMSYKPSRLHPTEQAPKWRDIAYYNNRLVAYDGSNTWNISPDKDALKVTASDPSGLKYTAEDKMEEETIVELTANELGPVAQRPDGFLYKRLVETSKQTEQMQKDLEDAKRRNEGKREKIQNRWMKWVAAEGITNLSVACPGAFLDLQSLAQLLKERYLETQAALWPVVRRIKSFCTSHKFFLKRMQESAELYSTLTDDNREKKQKKMAKDSIVHARHWAKVLSRHLKKGKVPLDKMKKQLDDIKADLETQLGEVKKRLVRLRAQLEAKKEELKSIDTVLWISLAVVLVGEYIDLGIALFLILTYFQHSL